MGAGSGARRWNHRALILLAALALLQVTLLALETTTRSVGAQTTEQPNIVLIVTDDQRYDTLARMPEVQRLLMRPGMTLRKAIVTNPLCCPSRATILTGRYSHTTGVYSNFGSNGGWASFKASESDTIATALDAVGYRTALLGKYINGYGGTHPYVPPGWDRWSAFTGGGGYYYNYSMFDDAQGTLSYGSSPSDYSTDVIRRRAVGFIRGTPADTPLFMVVTPFAAHGPYTAARRHLGDLATATVRLGPAVNEADVRDKPRYIRHRAIVSREWVRTRTRDQWESLLAVDELVSRIMATLADTGRAANTLVIFMSDNGFSNREHRWGGKQVPYEESIRVPMVIRMPAEVPANAVSYSLVSNLDVAPTIADFAGASLSADGVSLRPLVTATVPSVRGSILLEHVEGAQPVPTYCGVRTANFTFVHYSTRAEELYDLRRDPRQLENVASARPKKRAALRALTKQLCRPRPPGFSW